MPVDQIGIAGIVDDLDRDRRAFLEAEQRPRHLIVVARGLDDFARPDFQRDRRDPDGVIGGRCRSLSNTCLSKTRLSKARAAGDGCEARAAGAQQEVAAGEARGPKGGGEKLAQPFGRGGHRLSPFWGERISVFPIVSRCRRSKHVTFTGRSQMVHHKIRWAVDMARRRRTRYRTERWRALQSMLTWRRFAIKPRDAMLRQCFPILRWRPWCPRCRLSRNPGHPVPWCWSHEPGIEAELRPIVRKHIVQPPPSRRQVSFSFEPIQSLQ